jgi:hypothetical protein
MRRLDDEDLHPRERIRAFQSAEFILAWNCDSKFSQIGLCASETPFLFADPNVSRTMYDYLRIANLGEAVESITTDQVDEIYHNKEVFKSVAKDTIREMRNLHTWALHIYNYERYQGPSAKESFPFSFDMNCPLTKLAERSSLSGIFFCFNPEEIMTSAHPLAILFPWICFLSEKNKEIINENAFKVSMITCLGIIVDSESTLKFIKKDLNPLPISILPLPLVSFGLNSWKERKLVHIKCKDKTSFSVELTTLKGVQNRALTVNQVLISEKPLRWEKIKSLVMQGIPFVCPRAVELPSYVRDCPCFYNGYLTPQNVKDFLSTERMYTINLWISTMQVNIYCDEFGRTEVGLNCTNTLM